MTVQLRRLESDWNTERHAATGWPQFLSSVRITGLRGWYGEIVEFRFPVVAIAGENGSGKSTALKVAAAAYRNAPPTETLLSKTFNPEDFFPDTQWEAVEGVTLEYQAQLGTTTSTYTVKKPTSRWRGLPDRPQRRLFFLDISRTQPIDTLIGYGKIAKETSFGDVDVDLDEPNRLRLSRILKRAYTSGKMVVAGQKQVGVVEYDGVTYSNFHQGAGEDSTADLVALLQQAPSHSLIVIDEIEASLHPRAQRRLINEIFTLAREKKLQFILSTHSPFVLEQLPEQARVYVQAGAGNDRSVLYGISHQYALSMMDDEEHPDITAYCEDEDQTSAHLIFSLLAVEDAAFARQVKVIPVGPASVVKTLGALAAADRLPSVGLGVLDADEAASAGCVRLPGAEAPEREVFSSLDEGDFAALAPHLNTTPAGLREAITDAMSLANHHEWTKHIAAALGGTVTPRKVWEEAAEHWARVLVDPAERAAFAQSFRDRLS